MPTRDRFFPGEFCWFELASSDVDRAKDFYTTLFGWTFEDSPISEGEFYTQFYLGGNTVAATFPQQEQERTAGIPSHWNPYICVEDADQSAKVAEVAGATIVVEPFDVMEFGRMAVICDPTGAIFCMWQPRATQGVQVVNEDGSKSWMELLTKEPAAAKTFYSEVFGWEPTDVDMDNGTYTTFQKNGEWTAGMFEIKEEWGSVSPIWTLYFQVADAVATVEKIKELGGRVLMGPDSAPGVGTFAQATDPSGAVFAVLQPEQQA